MVGKKLKVQKPHRRSRSGMALVAGASLALTAPAIAGEIDVGNPDFKIRWDNTLKYSAAFRLRDPSNELTGPFNGDDGDRNFQKGLISNRGDLLTELDVTYAGSFGGRISAAAWYDSVYRQNTDASPGTSNGITNAYNQFNKDTARLHGKNAEVLDAFLFKKFDMGESRGIARAGRHTLVYGETLFMGGNGIAAAQGPIDAIKALQVPNTQFKELGRPVNQVSTDVQLNDRWAFGGYYQLEWRKTLIPSAGSYFSDADLLDAGGERIRDAGTGMYFYRKEDIEARDQGQFGLKLRYRAEEINTDFGFYAANYHDKAPTVVYVQPLKNSNFGAGKLGEYQVVYAEDIQTYGVSANTTIGEASVAAEFSWRHNTPLLAQGAASAVTSTQFGDNNDNTFYPRGDSAHFNMSAIHVLAGGPLWQSLAMVGEVGVNRRMNTSSNMRLLDSYTTKYAVGTRFVVTPTYYQVIPGLDIDVPIGVGFNPYGRSSVASFGPLHGGDMSIGLKATLNNTWIGTLQYTHYYGDEGPNPTVGGNVSFEQSKKDRDFISLSVARTF